MSEPLTRDEIIEEYIRATECELATLEHLLMLKSSTKSSLKRHFDLSSRMISVCSQIGIDPGEIKRNGRVKELLESDLEPKEALLEEAKDTQEWGNHDIVAISEWDGCY